MEPNRVEEEESWTYFEDSDLKYNLFYLLYKASYLFKTVAYATKKHRRLLIFEIEIKEITGWGMPTEADFV
jgi:hypothetical protein